ncbi:hypothetical protein F5Y18DRAFT_437783 [Xylariaceae sp. FL1019]|nr:hypothetical protein F5Y18DRAFT_437783 [Xylariaceae sp. FL1019]
MPRRRDKQKLKLPGFQYQLGEHIFTNNMHENEIMRRALLGPDTDDMTTEQLRAKMTQSLEELLDVCMRLETLARGVGLEELYWTTVNGQWNSHGPLTDRLTAQLVYRFIGARRLARQQNDNPNTALVAKADSFLAVYDDIQAQPRPQPTTLPVRLTGFGQMALNLGQLGISTGNEVAVAAPPVALSAPSWPPPHLSAKERHWVTDPRIESYLKGITYLHMPPKGLGVFFGRYPNEYSEAKEVKHFLCAMVLYHQNPAACNWTIYANPVAFVNNNERDGWLRAIGNVALMYDTAHGLASYAAEQFRVHRFDTIVGLVSGWPSEDLKGWESKSSGRVLSAQQDDWLKNRQTYSFLCILSNTAGPGMRMTIYDPFHQAAANVLPRRTGDIECPAHSFKRAICNQINRTFQIFDLWHGGLPCHIDAPPNNIIGPMGNSLRYLYKMVEGGLSNPLSDSIEGVAAPRFTAVPSPRNYFDGLSDEGIN